MAGQAELQDALKWSQTLQFSLTCKVKSLRWARHGDGAQSHVSGAEGSFCAKPWLWSTGISSSGCLWCWCPLVLFLLAFGALQLWVLSDMLHWYSGPVSDPHHCFLSPSPSLSVWLPPSETHTLSLPTLFKKTILSLLSLKPTWSETRRLPDKVKWFQIVQDAQIYTKLFRANTPLHFPPLYSDLLYLRCWLCCCSRYCWRQGVALASDLHLSGLP